MFVFRCHPIIFLIVLIDVTTARIFDRCDFVRTLRYKHNFSLSEINIWACIAQYQSGFNTEAIGYDSDGTGYHGMFQISDRYWCSTKNQINTCAVSCSKLLDDDLTDDFACISRIFEENDRISGNGYYAWTSYNKTCQYLYDGLFTNDCFVGDVDYVTTTTTTTTKPPSKSQSVTSIQNKIYNRCELARELWFVHKLPADQIATWVCIAKHESNYNTSAIGGGDHGLFQISDIYWCSPPGRGWVCGLSCAKLEDSDISDDVKCMKKIYEEHQRLSGDGFNAWSVYKHYCKNRSEQYIEGCFDNNDSNSLISSDDDLNSEELDSGETFRHSVKTHPGKTKIYERCELAKELHKKHKVPLELVANYVCIAYYESKYNTSAIGHLNVDGSGDHGIFQISDIYWCSPPGMGRACGLSCDKLEDTDIGNDVECMKKIYNEHQRLSGDGFNAWSVYEPYCKGQSERFVDGCFRKVSNSLAVLSHRPAVTAPPNINFTRVIQPKGKVFERCELANELRFKHNVPVEQISTWICIAKHSSNYNTSAQGHLNADGSENHGIFQISDIYWCSSPGKGHACGVPCSKLKDSDIGDDVACINKIYNEHQRLSGDGFNAWASYREHCYDTVNFAEGCFQDEFNKNIFADTKPTLNGKDKKHVQMTTGKIYERCELARELRDVHDIPMDEISNWVCIAYHESHYNTAAIGRLNSDGSGDHGIFQISDIYWCSHSERGKGCFISCLDLENSNITDDVQCVKKIFEEHSRISGDGFNAWTVYEPYCKGQSSKFTDECFEDKGSSVYSFNRRPGITSPTLRPSGIVTLKSFEKTVAKSEVSIATSVPTQNYFEKYTTEISTTPSYTFATSANPTQSPNPTPKITETKIYVNPFSTATTTTTTPQYKDLILAYQFSQKTSNSVTYRPTTTQQSERQRVQSVFDIYFNGFKTPRPTTQKFVYLTTQRPVDKSNLKVVSSSLNNLNSSSRREQSNSSGMTNLSSRDSVMSVDISNVFKDISATTKTRDFSTKKRTGFVFGVNVPTTTTTHLGNVAFNYDSKLSSLSLATTSSLPLKPNPTIFLKSDYTQATTTAKSAFLLSKNSVSRTSPPDATTINPFIQYTTPANSKITYQSIFSQRPSLTTTLHSLPAYNSNRLTTTTTKSPSINQIINTHDNSVSLYNNRFTRAPSSTPNNIFKLTTSEHIQYQQTTTQNPFDKIFDLFVH